MYMERKIMGLPPKRFTTAFITAYLIWFIIFESILVASNLFMGRSLEGTVMTSSIFALCMVIINTIIYKVY